MTPPLSRDQTADLADRIADLLQDGSVQLNPTTRARWEGALSALACVLGEPDRLPIDQPDRFGL
jgi:hypothetical protein